MDSETLQLLKLIFSTLKKASLDIELLSAQNNYLEIKIILKNLISLHSPWMGELM